MGLGEYLGGVVGVGALSSIALRGSGLQALPAGRGLAGLVKLLLRQQVRVVVVDGRQHLLQVTIDLLLLRNNVVALLYQ